MIKTKCPVCNLHLRDELSPSVIEGIGQGYRINCYRCGSYLISLTAAEDVISYFKTEKERYLLSSWIYNQNGNASLTPNNLKELVNIKKPTVGERATNLFLYITNQAPEFYQSLDCSILNNQLSLLKSDYETVIKVDDKLSNQFVPFLSISWSDSPTDVEFLIKEYLVKEKQYLKLTSGYTISIATKGWAFLDNYYYGSIKSDLVFIAMKFNDDLIDYSRKWFETAISEAGYVPKAMYEHKHTSLIDVEMKALIRRSKFIIVDLTENSRGAYYEAGFAHGLGKRVIFLCEKTFFENKSNKLDIKAGGIHFDTNHYTFIRWEWKKGKQLKKKLRDFIEGAIKDIKI